MMSVIFSLVRKDLRLLRWPWLAWLGVLLSQIALAVWCVLATRFTPKEQDGVTLFSLILTTAQGILAYVLVLRLVQADAPLRTRAFWRTRPITGGGLLAAKALAAFLLFGLAPVLVWSPWWLVNGLRGADLALAAADVLFWQTIIILPAFLIASVVDSFERAVLWSIVQCAMIICFDVFTSQPFVSPGAVSPELSASRMVTVCAVVALVFPALVVWQFLRRRTVAVITGYVLLYLAAVAIALYSPYDFKPRTPQRTWPEIHPEVARNFALHAVSAKYIHDQYAPSKKAWVGLSSKWTLEGVPAGYIVFPHIKSLDFKTGDSRTFQAVRPFANADFAPAFNSLKTQMTFPPTKPGTSGASPELDAALTAPEKESVSLWIRTDLKPNDIALLRVGPPAVNAELSVTLEKLELRFDAPLSPGVWHADSNGGLRIATVESVMNGLNVRLVTTRAESSLGDLWNKWHTTHNNLSTTDRGYEDYFIHQDEIRPTYLNYWGRPVHVGGIDILRIDQNLSPSKSRLDANRKPIEVELGSWSAGLRLARIAYREEARFNLTGRSDSLEITGSPDAPPKKP